MATSVGRAARAEPVKGTAAVEETPIPVTIRDVVAKDVKPPPLDDVDLALLRELVADARVSQRQLAVKLGISAPTVSERMARLERNGVVTGYTAQVDLAAIGYPQTVHLGLEGVAREQVPVLMQQLSAIEEIESVSLITGQWDLIVRLRTRDYTHFRSVLMDKVWAVPGMSSMVTMMTIAETPTKNVAQGILDTMISARQQPDDTNGATG